MPTALTSTRSPGSAMECAAHIDCYRQLAVIDDEQYASALALLEPIVAMLTKLCR